MWGELADRYEGWMEGEGRRPHTVRGYRGDLAGLVRVLDEDVPGRVGVAGWVDSLEGLAPATARTLGADPEAAGKRGGARARTHPGAVSPGRSPPSWSSPPRCCCFSSWG